jgi:ArsR family transcriptional regulator, arsenate/arsenite/antimonite-responsive transcriptional repressor
MTRTAVTVPIRTDRRRGERCCGPSAKPTVRTGDAERLTADLTILAHPVRLQLLDVLLHNEGRVCVCDLEAAVPVKQPTVSHHLRLLRTAGLVTSERDGLWAYYRVRRDALAALRARIAGGLRELG